MPKAAPRKATLMIDGMSVSMPGPSQGIEIGCESKPPRHVVVARGSIETPLLLVLPPEDLNGDSNQSARAWHLCLRSGHSGRGVIIGAASGGTACFSSDASNG